jgi:hypothetical protein
MAEAETPVALLQHPVVEDSHFLSMHWQPFRDVLCQGDLQLVLRRIKSSVILDVAKRVMFESEEVNL